MYELRVQNWESPQHVESQRYKSIDISARHAGMEGRRSDEAML
jgi:hypothetical protein